MQFRRPPRRQLHGILLLDKPAGLSSHEAMVVARGILQAEKAGHTGTLDPLATGLLPVCFGKATALSAHLLDARKRYVADVRFGARTDTGDAAGMVTATSDPAAVDAAALPASLAAFTGEIVQRPPMYSAIKQGGVPLYALAREGVEVERASRIVNIESLALLGFENGVARLDVRCSKGTYIRTLAEDWAASLGQQAHLSALRRTEVGPFGGDPGQASWTLEALRASTPAERDAVLLPAAAALVGWRFVMVPEAGIARLHAGQSLSWDEGEPGAVAMRHPGGTLLGLGELVQERGLRLQPRRWFGPDGI